MLICALQCVYCKAPLGPMRECVQEVGKARDATDSQLSKLRKAAAAQQHRKHQVRWSADEVPAARLGFP